MLSKAPSFLVSVDSKGIRISVSLLESMVAEIFVNVDYKGVIRVGAYALIIAISEKRKQASRHPPEDAIHSPKLP